MEKVSTFSKLFARSPVRPIQDHMATVIRCTQLLKPFIDAALCGDWKLAEAKYNEISEIENLADEQKKEIRMHLPKSLFLPIPRIDLLNLVSMQDRIANTAKDISGLVLGRKIVIPGEISNEIADFIDSSVAVSVEAKHIIDELDELIETGFGGKEIKLIEKLINNLDDLEGSVDQIERDVRARLHEIESGLNPIDVMFLYKIIELIGNLADRAQKSGDQLHIIVAR